MSKDHLERNPKLYLVEILDFIEIVEDYTKSMSYDDFANDRRTVDAVDSNIRKMARQYAFWLNTEQSRTYSTGSAFHTRTSRICGRI